MEQDSTIRQPQNMNENEELERLIEKRKKYELMVIIEIIIFICAIILGHIYISNNYWRGGRENKDYSYKIAQLYNAEFEAYEGNNVTGSDVRALINKINARNRQNASEPSLQIQVTSGGTATTTVYSGAVGSGLSTAANSFAIAKTYTVKMGYDSKSGYIVGVDIVDNTTNNENNTNINH